MLKHNLLLDALISVRTTAGDVIRCSLPDVYLLAVADKIADFPTLRPHQAPAWHMLLVQLAVLSAMESSNELPQSADGWRSALRKLTPNLDDDQPWQLIVADWTQPAFLQPPIPTTSGRIDYKRRLCAPDALDVLITSKNHDIKRERIAKADPEDWLYALVTLQTMEGSLGRRNYGICRMNGGFANRSMLRTYPSSLGVGGQWLRDVMTLLREWPSFRKLSDSLGVGNHEPVHRFLWTLPWDGTASLSLRHMHPLALEVCRRVRLVEESDNVIHAMTAGSRVARVNASATQGVVADPWTPLDMRDTKKGIKSFTVTGEGFGYRRMASLLDPTQFKPAFLQRPTAGEKPEHGRLTVLAAGLARGKGKTEGFHSRKVQWGVRASLLLAGDDDRITNRMTEFLQMASSATGKILRPAIFQLIDAKSDPDWKNPANDAISRSWLARLDATIDSTFFEEVDASFEAGENDEDAAARWAQVLERLIRKVFDEAAVALPRKEEARYLGMARASNFLDRALKKNFPSLRKVVEQKEVANVEVE